ncbi:hypothetical protein EA473_06430 [Natrarchaeobius chitinivorans]|uniref:Uncharacterized protein n=1 Tax=Natrarchaeobius chitinivorans TaxID=1679083 RepID=A0A3N6MJ58_NATCH|nr:hypothetical protein EA473_06430 [Natrarchaeobius chitinivorans]
MHTYSRDINVSHGRRTVRHGQRRLWTDDSAIEPGVRHGGCAANTGGDTTANTATSGRQRRDLAMIGHRGPIGHTAISRFAA